MSPTVQIFATGLFCRFDRRFFVGDSIVRRWGAADDFAWERAHDHYMRLFAHFSDVQEQRPIPLRELELEVRE